MNYVQYNQNDLQTFEYETTIQSDESIVGTCELGKATIQMINDSNNYSSFKGSWIQTPHGSFYVYNVEPVQEKVNIKLDCYDIKYKLDTPYDSTKHIFPMNLKAWRNSIFDACGVEYDNSDFPNSDLLLEVEPYVGDNPSNRQVMSLIAQAGASNVITDSDDKFYFSWFEDDIIYIVNDWIELTTEKESSDQVNCVVLGRGDTEDNVYYPESKPTNPVEFRIDNNYILDPQNVNSSDDQRYEVIEDIYNQVNGFSYLVFNMRSQSINNKLSIKLGQKVKYTDIWGNELTAYVMTKKINWLGGNLSDDENYEVTLSAEKVKETSTEFSYATSTYNKILQVERKADKNSGLIEDTIIAQEDFSNSLTQLQLSQEQLSAKVNSVVDVTREISGNNNIVLEDATEGDILVLKISGNISKLLPPFYPGQETYLKNMNLVIENETGEKEKIELPFNRLLSYNNVSDEFVIDETGTYIIRRIGQKDDLSFYILSNEQTETLQNITIPLNEGYNKIYLESFENAHFYAKYAFQNELVSTFATKVEMNSALELQNENINIELSKKVDDDEIIAKINLSTEKAEDGSLLSIQADKIKLEGLVTANENFKINLDGSIETKNMYLPNGGRVIGGDGLFSNLQFISEESIVGYTYNTVTEQYEKSRAIIYCYIPQNFTIDSAKVTIIHTPVKWTDVGSSGSSVLGACKNVGLFYSNGLNRQLQGAAVGYFNRYDSTYFSEISDAFGENRFTADTPTETSRNSQIVESIDVKSSLSVGQNILSIETANATPSNMQTAYEENGDIIAIMNIIGYIKSENNEEGSDN